MDCIQAQSIVSEAMDRQPMPPAVLAEAKEHCRTCPECAVFVRAQLVAKKAPLPIPPADLTDRVMAQVRAEAAEKAAAIAAAEEAARGAQAAAEAAAAAPPPPPVTLAPRPARKRQLPRMWVSAAAAAAVVVALLGTGAVVIFGMKAISGGTPTEAPSVADRSGEQPSYGAVETSEDALGDGAAPAKGLTGPRFITVNGTVYSWSRVDDTNVATLRNIGMTTTSLGGTGKTASRPVYVGRSPDTVYVVDDADAVQAFVRLTRDYHGQTYVLVSSELTGYGQWPSLPAGMTAPTSPDGLPTFVAGATDSSGVQTYKPAVATGVNGIAIAPSTDTGPMANNPNWTWWIPSR